MQGTMIYGPRDDVSWAPADPFRFCAFSEQLLDDEEVGEWRVLQADWRARLVRYGGRDI
jgi:hypothetical protein